MEKMEINNKSIYAGFLIRTLSGIIDYIIYLLFFLIIYILSLNIWSLPKYYYIAFQIIHLTFLIIYNIFITQRFGGTPGKLILKIKVLKLKEYGNGKNRIY
jgi:uncharacterized RDD family membrane protein YckC